MELPGSMELFCYVILFLQIFALLQGTPSRFRERSSTPGAMPAAFRGGGIVGGVGDVGDVGDVEYKFLRRGGDFFVGRDMSQ